MEAHSTIDPVVCSYGCMPAECRAIRAASWQRASDLIARLQLKFERFGLKTLTNK